MSASNDADEAMIARWETTAHGIYTGENATEFARLIALARRTTVAEARVEEMEAGLRSIEMGNWFCRHDPEFDEKLKMGRCHRPQTPGEQAMTFTIPPAWGGAIEKAYDAADDAYTDDKNLRECTVAAITAFFAALEEQGIAEHGNRGDRLPVIILKLEKAP